MTQTMKCLRLAFGCALGCAFAASGQASELYSFSFTPTSGSIKSFSFSFEAPGIVTNNESPTFTSFAVTDGTNQWTMTQDLANDCFMFGTAAAIFGGPFGACEVAASGAGNGGFFFSFNNILPSTPGSYTSTSVGGTFDLPTGGLDSMGGTANLTISSVTAVPEPPTSGSVALWICMLALAGLFRRHPQIVGRGGCAAQWTKLVTSAQSRLRYQRN
jgi:hypothetical protein